MRKTLYVTTTIPYVNAPPHIGFALELVQSDAIARYQRLIGRTVRFQTGTDENAFKNVLSARARGVPVEQLVNENAERFRALCTALGLTHDAFVRTTSPRHHDAVHAFLARLRPDDIYRKPYSGLYCSGCEDFYLPRDLEEGHCPEHRVPVTAVEEQNYFFRLSAYQQILIDHIESRRIRIVPAARETEVLRFIERGLDDISISRDAVRSAGWGVPYPGDASQVVYVWIDALVNYLTGLRFPHASSDRDFWSDDALKLHVIGKNVWKFHAVYWPALLLSAGLPVPDTIFVHGFLTIDGKKISKSAGDATDPVAFIDQFGCDALRFYLLRHVRPFEDTDFSIERLTAAYTNDLANGLGNLVSRLTRLCESAGLEAVQFDDRAAPTGFHEHIGAFRFDRALVALWDAITRLNREISETRPWQWSSEDTVLIEHLLDWCGRLDAIAYWLQPFLPQTSACIQAALRAPRIVKAAALFPRRSASKRVSATA
jgi:methionyl-tRNA synthetase